MTPPPFSHVPLLDHHCHPFLRVQPQDPEGFRACFTESDAPDVIHHHVPYTLFYRRAVRDLADFFACSSTEASVLETLRARPLEQRAQALFSDAGFAGLLLDLGYRPAACLSLAEMRKILPLPMRPILRVETLAEELLPHASSWQAFEERFSLELRHAADRVVAFKSILAYRCGLNVRTWSSEDCEMAFADSQRAFSTGRRRLTAAPILHTLFLRTLEVAAERGLPVQVHTGFGDRDLDLRLANPLHLRPLLEDDRLVRAPVILLHAHPYVEEAAWLTSIYPHVYVDLSLTVPFLAHRAASAIADALALAPATKILLATDAHSVPELYWVAARHLRDALDRALTEASASGYLQEDDRDQLARLLLHDNAVRVYRLTPPETTRRTTPG